MEYSLMNAKYWMDYKKVLKCYPDIEKNFSIRIEDTSVYDSDGRCHEDSNLYIIINTLEDLLLLIKIIDTEIVLNDKEILIYDDYIE